MSQEIAYRWVNGWEATEEEWNRIEEILAARGWLSLNSKTSRILMAENPEGKLLGFFVLQMIVHTEPMWIAPSARGTGIADELADRMFKFMLEIKARGWVVIADNPSAAKMCRELGMKQVESPVFVAV